MDLPKVKTIFDLDKDACRELILEGNFDFGGNYDSPRFEKVTEISAGESRWTKTLELIVKDNLLGKLYRTSYQQGLTEIQDERPFEYTSPKWVEVEEVTKTIVVTEYKETKND